MRVKHSMVNKLTITDVTGLDPITVYAEDFGPGQGKITITCFGEAWSHYWSHMGETTKLADFFCSCDEDYLAHKLKTGIDDEIDDDDSELLEQLLKKEIIKDRLTTGIGKDRARELWKRVVALDPHDITEKSDLCFEVLGDEWWYRTPKKPNPNYQYLCCIINAVKAALREAPHAP